MILLTLFGKIKPLYIFQTLQILFTFEIFTRASVFPKGKQAKKNSTTDRLKAHELIQERYWKSWNRGQKCLCRTWLWEQKVEIRLHLYYYDDDGNDNDDDDDDDDDNDDDVIFRVHQLYLIRSYIVIFAST